MRLAAVSLLLLFLGLASVASGDPARMAVTGAAALSAPATLPDPFPIRRLRIADAQLDAKAKEFGTGPFVRMPRAEFEARVRAAAEEREPPRLVEANYSATPDGSDLVGEAEWTFLNRRAGPAACSLEPIRLAIRSATWEDGSAATLGTIADDVGLAVRVPPGKHTLRVKWSAAGSGGDADRSFDLRLPPCSAATLALDLPPDRVPANAPDVLLTGPFPSARDPKLKQWRFRFGDRARLELGVRGPSDLGGPVVVTNASAKYDLGDTQFTTTFDFDLKTASGTRAEWAFAVPAGLTVTDAVANDRAAWRFEAPTRTLIVQLRQASNGGKFVIAASGPVPPGLAPLPAIRPANAVGSVERIELRTPLGVALDRLDPGDYRLADAATADGVRTTTLLGTLLAAPAATRKPPAIRVASLGAEFTSSETLNGRLDANRVVIEARAEVAVRRGPLFRLAVRTPPGYTLDRLASEPEDAVAFSAAIPGGVEVEFAKPLATGQKATIQFEFRGAPLVGERIEPLPVFGPIGATERDGRLAFAPSSGWSIAVQPTGELGGDVVKGFRYRGAEPAGTLRFTPIRPAFLATLDPDLGRVRIAPTRGLVESIRLLAPPGPRTWRANGAVLASASPTPIRSFGTLWTLTLLRPTAEPVVLETAPGSLQVLDADDVRIERSNATEAGATNRGWVVENLTLVTAAEADAPIAALAGAILIRGGASLPIRLPAGAAVLSATVGRHAIDTSLLNTASGELLLPIPESNEAVKFEVRYRLPRIDSYRAASPLPELPGVPGTVARWWAAPADRAAVWPWHLRASPFGLAADSSLTHIRSDEPEIVAAPLRQLDLIAIAATALIAILSWIGCRVLRKVLGAGILLFALVAGSAIAIGPEAWSRALLPPTIAALLGGGVIAALRGWKPRRIAAALLLVPATAAAAPPAAEAEIVFLLDGDIVAVPKSLLDRLAPPAADPPFTLGSASYTGRIEDGLARFTATFTVHSSRDGESILDLPLADVRLERATVDGQPAAPLASKADTYSLPIAGRGPHVIEVRFAAAIATTGAEREVKFGIPAAPDSTASFTAPLTARQLQVVSRNGFERTSKDKDANRIEAALGAVRSLHLRWREGPAGASATLAVREGCIWDVAEAGHRLTACYQIQVKSGTVPSFRFDLPSNLEPTRVAVRSLDSLLVPIVVREWNVGKESNGARPLTIDLIAPADGRVLVTLECEPRTMPLRQPVLDFPRPAGMTRESAVYGLRSAGVSVEGIGRTGVIDFAADALLRDFGAVPDLRLTPASSVVAFSPRAGEVAELRPVLKIASASPNATQDATWDVEPPRAIGRGVFAWSGGDALTRLEFPFAPAIQEVRGADVATWSQSDGRVQVWFKRAAKEGSFEWTATMPTPANAPFEPPPLAAIGARNAGQIVRLRAAAGWSARIDREKGWRAISNEDREWVFQSEGSLPPPRMQLIAAAPRPSGPEPILPPRPVENPERGSEVRELPPPPAPALPPAAPSVMPGWIWAAAWAGMAFGALLLFIKSPRSTWPEQLGLIGALLGYSLAGQFAWGIAVYAAARNVWLFRVVLGSRT